MYATSLSHLLHVDSKAADTWADWARKHTAFIETANKNAVHQEQLKIARTYGTIGFICASGAYGGAGIVFKPTTGVTDTVNEQEATTEPDDDDSYVIDHPLEVRGYRPPIVITALPLHSYLHSGGERSAPQYNLKASFYLTQVPKSLQNSYPPRPVDNGPMRIINKSDCPNWLLAKLEKLVERKSSQYIPTLKLLGVQEPVFAIHSSRDITNFGLYLGKPHAHYGNQTGIPRPALPALVSMLSRDLRPLAELMQLKGNYTFPQ